MESRTAQRAMPGWNETGEWNREPAGHAVEDHTVGGASPLRILIVAPSMEMVGGQSIHAARLLAALGEEPSLKVGFVAINPRLPAPLRWMQKIKYLRTIVNSLVYCAELLARVPAYDIIHVSSASNSSFAISPTPAILIAKAFGKKMVLNYHGGQAEEHLQNWGRSAIPTIRLADVTAVQSGYLVDIFARYGLEARAIFNHVELDHFRFRERRPLRPIFLSCRTLEPEYNVACVLRAFARIQKRFMEARLIVAGDGSLRSELEKLARELGLQHTEFIGMVAPEKMPALFNGADMLLNATTVDNMPLSIIEAFASGLLVVTSDAGGIPYLVSDGETGLLVHCHDAEAMAAAAIRLLEDQTLSSKIAAQARAECEKYTWSAVRDEWLKLYRELAPANETVETKA